jgi:hypothetical protein
MRAPLAEILPPAPFPPPQRDFLIELMEAKGDEATGELYAEEQAARERAEQQRRAAVPGLQNPYAVPDADDDL